MFIDSDFNANSFGNFDTDAMQDNSLYASGEYYNAAASVNYIEFVIKYANGLRSIIIASTVSLTASSSALRSIALCEAFCTVNK